MARTKNQRQPQLPDDLTEYRAWLVAAEQKSQEDFDKTVLTLSGGALGISFVFLKDIVGVASIREPVWLLASWFCWGTSSLAVLASFYTSHHGLRRAIKQVDAGTIRTQPPGGWIQRVTASLNATGALLFLAGVISMTVFVNENIGKNANEQAEKSSASVTSTNTANPPPSAADTTTRPASAGPGLTEATVHGRLPGTSAAAEEVK